MAMTPAARPVSQRIAPRATERTMAGPGLSRSGADTGTPSPQGGGQPHRDQPVQRDRHKQQESGDRLIPERRDAEHVQRRVDRVEQQRADRRAYRTAAATEDR